MAFDDRAAPLCPAKAGGWPAERSKGGGAAEGRPGGHERSRPPDGLGCRAERVARDWFGDDFVDHFAATREWEWRQWLDGVTDWELKRYFEII